MKSSGSARTTLQTLVRNPACFAVATLCLVLFSPSRSFSAQQVRSFESLTVDERSHLPDDTRVKLWGRTLTMATLRQEHRARLEQFSSAAALGKAIGDQQSLQVASAQRLDQAGGNVANTSAVKNPGAGGLLNANTVLNTSPINPFLVPREGAKVPIPLDYLNFCNAAQATACIYLPPNRTLAGPTQAPWYWGVDQKIWQALQGNVDQFLVDVDPLITDPGLCASFGGSWNQVAQVCDFFYFFVEQTSFKLTGALSTAASCDQPSSYDVDPQVAAVTAKYPPAFNSPMITTGATAVTCVVRAWMYPQQPAPLVPLTQASAGQSPLQLPAPQPAPANSTVLLPSSAFQGGVLTGMVIGPDDQPVANTAVEIAGAIPATLTGEVIGEQSSNCAAGDPSCQPQPQPTPGVARKAGGDPGLPPLDCAKLLARSAGVPGAGVPNAATAPGAPSKILTDAAGRFALCMAPNAPAVNVNIPGATKIAVKAITGSGGLTSSLLTEPPTFFQPGQVVSLTGTVRNLTAAQNNNSWILRTVGAWSPDGRQSITAFRTPLQAGPGPLILFYTGSDGQPYQMQAWVFKILRAFLDRSQLHSNQGARFEYDVQFASQTSSSWPCCLRTGQQLCVEMRAAGPIVVVQPPPEVIPVDSAGLGKFSGKIRATQVMPGSAVPFELTPNIHVCGQSAMIAPDMQQPKQSWRSISSLSPEDLARLPSDTLVKLDSGRAVNLGVLRAEHSALLEGFSKASELGKAAAARLASQTPIPISSNQAATIPLATPKQGIVGKTNPSALTADSPAPKSRVNPNMAPPPPTLVPMRNPVLYPVRLSKDWWDFCTAASATACIYLPANTTFTMKWTKGGWTLFQYTDPLITDEGVCVGDGGNAYPPPCTFVYPVTELTDFAPNGSISTTAACDPAVTYTVDPHGAIQMSLFLFPDTTEFTTGSNPITCAVQVWLSQ